MISRHLGSEVGVALRASRIVNVVGPRQSGKSTLVRFQIPVAEYLTMDSKGIRDALRADAYTQLRALRCRRIRARLGP